MEQENKKEFMRKVGLGVLVTIAASVISSGFTFLLLTSGYSTFVLMGISSILHVLALLLPLFFRKHFTRGISYVGYYVGLIVLPILIGVLIFGACIIVLTGIY